MTTKTQTTTTHYHIQKKRRAEFLEEWRNYRQSVIRKEDVKLEKTARGLRTGVFMGWDGDRPTRCLDALVHEVDPGVTTTIHRHSWDAILFMAEGSGWTEWEWRALRLEGVGRDPHSRLELAPPRQRRRQAGPLHELFLRAHALDARHELDRGCRPRDLRQAAREAEILRRHSRRRSVCQPLAAPGAETAARSGRIHTPYDEQEILATPRGTRTKFLNDRAIGNQASGLTQVMIQFAPGKTQSLHRHPGEAWLYVVEGYGHSFMGTAPDKGEHHPWKKGDLIVVDHFLWHQHFNDDPKNQCRLVRIHMFDSILETMRALMDPMVLFEEAEDTLVSMQELSQIQWPDDKRPGE